MKGVHGEPCLRGVLVDEGAALGHVTLDIAKTCLRLGCDSGNCESGRILRIDTVLWPTKVIDNEQPSWP